MDISLIIDQIYEYFISIGRDRKIDPEKHKLFFSKDFKMVINGKIVLEGLDALDEHFNHLLSQTKQIEMDFHDKIVAANSCVMRYDLKDSNSGEYKVIAIFKFRDDKAVEMNEVVYTVDNGKSMDFISK